MSSISERVKKLGGSTGMKPGAVAGNENATREEANTVPALVQSKNTNIANRVKALGGDIAVKPGADRTLAEKPAAATTQRVATQEEGFWSKLGRYLSGASGDTTLPTGTARQSETSDYLVRRAASDAVGSAKGIVNEIGYLGQAVTRGQMASEAAKMRQTAGMIGTDTAQKAADTFDQNVKKIEGSGLKTAVNWGEKFDAETEKNYNPTREEQIAGDVAGGVGGMIPSILANFLVPGSGLYVMATGAAGNATEEAIKAGATDNGALAYGASVGIIEAATEKMFDGVSGIFGKGYASEAIDKLVKRKVSNELAQKAIIRLASMAGEGFEEFVAEYTENWANRVTADTDMRRGKELWGDAWYSFAIGGLVSAVMEAADMRSLNPDALAERAVENTKAEQNQALNGMIDDTQQMPAAQVPGSGLASPAETVSQQGAPVMEPAAIHTPATRPSVNAQTAPKVEPLERTPAAQNPITDAHRTVDREGISRVASEMEKEGGKAGASALNSFYNDDIPAADFYADFAKAYEAGRNGKDINAVATSVINSPTKQAAYIAGQADAKRGQNAVVTIAATTTGEKKPAASTVKASAAFTKALNKWAASEWVNVQLDSDMGASFQTFARKWYDAGLNGTPELNIKRADSDDSFPAFLESVFYNVGKDDAAKAAKKATAAAAQSPERPLKPAANQSTIKSEEKPAEKAPETKPDAAADKTSSEKLADMLKDRIGSREFSSAELFKMADEAFGGTQAQGTYSPKDAYDALELAVNRWILDSDYIKKYGNLNNTANANATDKMLVDMLRKLPTQTKRTEEQQTFQQFSTPPNIAYLAAWAANITGSDVVLEPSAGIGGLAVFPKAWGAHVVVNELSARRLGVLKSMGFDRVFNENAEQIDNILPDDIKPSVVIMNPPFSSTAGRTSANKTANATKHIEQALNRLNDGGRLVTILGKGMSDNSSFSGWWNTLRKSYDIRANIAIDGENYKKYGTTWGVQLVVIDKTGPQTGDTITGEYKDLSEVPGVLEGIRNDRTSVQGTSAGSRGSVPERGNVNTDAGGPGERHQGSPERTDGSPAGSERGAARPSAGGRGPVLESGNAAAVEQGAEGGNRQQPAKGNGAVSEHEPVTAEQLGGDRPVTKQPLQQLSPKKASKNDNGVYAEYVPENIPFRDAAKHPAPLVESAAMAAVQSPAAAYVPNLPASLIKSGALSDAQLENIVNAGQAHTEMLPNGERKGYFIGDGTGVGKGRQISGIVLDNFRQGRTKAVWVSKNSSLYEDAVRDWTDIGGDKGAFIGDGKGKLKANEKVTAKSGILFTTYDTLRSASKENKAASRLDQLVNWLGEDFDGVIAFDEAHNMGNLLGKQGSRGKTKGSAKAEAGVELQRRLPKARVIYVSATGATDVNELAYAQRLGLWGQGTAFNDVNDFVSKIGSSGLAAMELVARDMKSMGVYLARSISYDGVEYDTLQHDLTPEQREIYDTMSRAWQITIRNVNEALGITGGNLSPQARSSARSAYYGAMQRFYNQVLTSMSMPSVIEDIRKELGKGHSAVLQIVNTNEAELNRQLTKIKEQGGELDDLDLTPRGTLIGYLENSFPIYSYEEYEDDDGNKRSRVVADSAGNPVINKQAVKMRDNLIAQINQMSIPDGPLEMLFNAFGADEVAEVTGRTRRVVPRKNSKGETVMTEERRTPNHNSADVQAFQDGKKRILVFSDAGGTGKSYHADVRAKNQQKRTHYLIQPGWSATAATQGFGRTHRSNEVSTPTFRLVTTDIMGQKRFVSTIARRLDQLGALTKGQRETGSGMFTDKDNLESDLARDALRSFYDRLGKGQLEGLNGQSVLEKLGLWDKFTDEYGGFELDENLARDMNTFLNRILSLEVDEQNNVFGEFYRIFEEFYDKAVENGTLDLGMENVKADKIEILDDKVIRTQSNGAATKYVQAKTYRKPKLLTSVSQLEKLRGNPKDFLGLYRTDAGEVKAVYRIADKTDARGKVQKMFRMQTPILGKYGTWSEATLSERGTKIDAGQWESAWSGEVAKTPEYDEETVHMLTGTLLPIWNYLPKDGNTRAMRIIADDGSQYLGRVIPAGQIDTVLSALGAGKRTREMYTPSDLADRVLKKGQTAKLMNDRMKLKRSRVSGEWRIEITGQNLWYLPRNYPDIITENINYNYRYFIPTGEKGIAIIEKLVNDNPVAELVNSNDVEAMRAGKPSVKSATPVMTAKPEDRISIGMSDEQRFEKLKDRGIAAFSYDEGRLSEISADEYSGLDKISKSDAYAILRKIGEQFDIFTDYRNADINLEFAFSKNKLNESVSKQTSSYQNYAKMMTVFRDVIESAVGIEAHIDRYEKADSNIERIYELVSAFKTENGIVPVLLSVKEFNDGTKNSLHVVVSLNEIEGSKIVEHNPAGHIAGEPYSLLASTYKIADIFKNVNAKDGALLKYIPDGFLTAEQLAAKRLAQKKTQEYIARKNEKYSDANSKDNFTDSGTDRVAMWSTERVGDQDKQSLTLSEIFAKIRHAYNIPITKGNVRGAGVMGEYRPGAKTIRTRLANDLPTLSHELGHHIEAQNVILDGLTQKLKNELTSNLSAEMTGSYAKEKLLGEGFAEYIRRYLQNKETAAIDYPKFTEHFREVMDSDQLAKLDGFADEINAYYSLDADSASSSIRIDGDRAADYRTRGERFKDSADKVYQAWTDALHGIKLFDEATGGDSYKLASNSAYSDAVAYNLLIGDLTDIHGQHVSDGLIDALTGINTKSSKEYRDFGEYLVVKHGPERLAEGMRIFADDRKNSTAWMAERQRQLEAEYPEFKDVSEKLYEFQRNFLHTWGVQTGLISEDTFEQWGKRWQFYVPFNRDVGDKGRWGAKRSFANQNSTIKRARGSGLDIVHPVDNIINNMVKMVNAGARNNVMVSITDQAAATEGSGAFLERVPMPMLKKTFDATGLKDGLKKAAESAKLGTADENAVFGIIDNIDDILVQYGRGKAYGDVVTVLKDGQLQYWKINDPLLLSSLTNLSPVRLPGWMEAYGRVSRFITGNITGTNLVWSIFSNMPRDIMTFFTYSQYRNPFKMLAGIGGAYINKAKGNQADPVFKEYLAMGGGQTSAYTADKDLTRKIRRKMSRDKAGILNWANPVEWVEYISDMIELGPRFSYYKILRSKGYTPEEAFYGSTDITVNFRRGGVNSRTLNKFVPFFNAGVQGLDKFARWISAADAPTDKRVKTAGGRFTGWLAVSGVLAALAYGLNGGDDKKKEYAQLSTYTKNAYWCIPMGDGKYFCIPKPRELAVMSSFMEATLERFGHEDQHAYDGFYSYFADNCLPNVLNDIAQGDAAGAVGSLGVLGVASYMIANRDFLGRPIVSNSLSRLEQKDQYTSRTSKVAYWLGKSLNKSPIMIDYFFQNTLGGWWKVQRALMPVGSENIDYTLGVGNTYVKDNEYSTDLINRLYDAYGKAQKQSNSNPGDMESTITEKWYSNIADFYSAYNKLSKDDYSDGASRVTRQTVLEMVSEFEKNMENGYRNSAQRIVENYCSTAGDTSVMPSSMPTAIKDDDGYEHQLTASEYVRYQTEYLGTYWTYVEDAVSIAEDTSTENIGNVLSAAKAKAKADATANALYRKGVETKALYSMSDMDGLNITGGQYAAYKAALKAYDADGNGSFNQAEVQAAIDSLYLEDNAQRSYLWNNSFTKTPKNNPYK